MKKTKQLLALILSLVMAMNCISINVFAADSSATFMIKYHASEEEEASDITTEVVRGNATTTMTSGELGFVVEGKLFAGWKLYRESDGCWLFTDGTATMWATEQPEGYDYRLYSDGASVSSTVPAGDILHFYAQWKDNFFTIYYHETDTAVSSDQTTQVVYGVSTKILTIDELGFSQEEKAFAGWKLYRESDGCWLFTDGTTEVWAAEQPVGYTYRLYSDGTTVARTAPAASTLHLYAQWKDNYFTVLYHETDDADASDQTTQVVYGVSTKILTIDELGFSQEEKAFAGWKLYRELDGCWLFTDGTTEVWAAEQPAGYTYRLYSDGTTVARTAPAASTLHLYAQWKDNYFTVLYHETDEAEASGQITEVVYGVSTKILTIDELGFSREEKAFAGWKLYRESDECWLFTDGTTEVWAAEQPAGYTYRLYIDGTTISETVPAASTLHLYAQWKENYFTVAYHVGEEADPDAQTTEVVYGEMTKTLTITELGFARDGMVFAGWRCYRESDGCWRFTNGEDTEMWAQSRPEGYDYYLYRDGASVAQTSQPATTVHFYAQWSSTTVNVTDFGADGSDNLDDRAAIQQALNLARSATEAIKVIVPSGRYYVSNTLRIYSNTILELADDAVIVRMDDSKIMLMNGTDMDELAGGYDQLVNVVISGGTWDGNITSLNEQSYGLNAKNLLYLWHGSNITIENTILKNCCGNHFIELAAVKDSLIENVTMTGFVRYFGTDYSLVDGASNVDNESSGEDDENSNEFVEEEIPNGTEASASTEAIQLDYASTATSNSAAPFDNTVCQNITITGCTFNGGMSGIGSHHVDYAVTGLNVTNNEFFGIENSCLNLPNMQDVVIEYNNATDVASFVVAWQNTQFSAKNNIIEYNANSRAEKNMFSIMNSSAELSNNTVTGTGAAMIFCDNSTVVLDENNFDATEIAPQKNILYASLSVVEIYGTIFRNAGTAAIRLVNGSIGTIDGRNEKVNEIIEPGTVGISVSSSILYAYENVITKPGTVGISLTDSAGSVVSGQTITNAATNGIYATDCVQEGKSLIISENVISDCGNNGIVLVANDGEPEALVVSGNQISEAGYGIYASESDATISGNSISNTTTYGIRLVSCENAVVSNNIITESGQHGISTYLCTLSVEENSISESGANGIYAKGCDVAIEKNTIRTSGSNSIRVVDDEESKRVSSGYITNNTLYVQTISAVDTVTVSNNIVYTDAPGTVTLVSAKAVANGITVTWEECENARSYRIYRRTASGGWYKLVEDTGSTAVSYTDTTVQSGVTYYYTVRGLNGSQISANYDTAGVSAVYTAVPGTVTLVSAEAVANGITVTWEECENARSYRIYRRTASGGWYKLVEDTGSTAVSYTDTTVQSGVTYYYTVRGLNGSQISANYDAAGVSGRLP